MPHLVNLETTISVYDLISIVTVVGLVYLLQIIKRVFFKCFISRGVVSVERTDPIIEKFLNDVPNLLLQNETYGLLWDKVSIEC